MAPLVGHDRRGGGGGRGAGDCRGRRSIAIPTLGLPDRAVLGGGARRHRRSSRRCARVGQGLPASVNEEKCMKHNHHEWFGALVILVALISPRTAAADRSIHEVQITASRYAFDPAMIQVTAGEPVRLVIRSTDQVHGFAIPKLQIDVHVPKGGEPVTVDFTAPPPGRYEIACSEFCGRGHGQMTAALISIGPTPTSR